MREKDELNQKIDEQWEEVAAQPAIIPTTPPSFEGLGFPITAPDTHNMGSTFDIMATWLQKLLQVEDAAPMWLSSYQLLVHFQGFQGEYGLFYNKQAKEWVSADKVVQQDGYAFLQCAAWFMASIKNFGKCVGASLTIQSQMPWGTVFRSWQRCLLVAASPSVFQRVDALLQQQGAIAVKKVTTALKQCRAFRGELQ